MCIVHDPGHTLAGLGDTQLCPVAPGRSVLSAGKTDGRQDWPCHEWRNQSLLGNKYKGLGSVLVAG